MLTNECRGVQSEKFNPDEEEEAQFTSQGVESQELDPEPESEPPLMLFSMSYSCSWTYAFLGIS